MKMLSSAIVAFAAIGAIAAGPVSANAAPVIQTASTAKPTDSTLNSRIEARLKADATLKKYNLNVSVNNGVATVKGMVATEAQKLRAGTVAKVTGVTRVDNQVTVDKAANMSLGAETKDAAKKVGTTTKEGAEKVGEKTKEVAKTVGEKTKEGASVAADKTKAAVSKTGEVVTDVWITTKVKGDFVSEDTLKGSSINVDTSNHVVTLKGTVKTPAGRDRAVQIAKATNGVTRVVDQLVIGSK